MNVKTFMMEQPIIYAKEWDTMPEAIRSFIAFDIESASVLERITEMQKKLAGTDADLKFVEPKNIHITMRMQH